ncbi:alpha-L-rhamnosidase [Paenibacillus rigui]|uniref:alpha-L-rhamnosidase n=1 Tax=Paenibacillus rigui TaxID=554312 RepID=A0A229UX37_9BACL|nr:alpha-L-rhamnosidase [Paenibacillus rigui]OXM87994.1 alpha-L-rhamnosidase [Paenibacillus rigui]
MQIEHLYAESKVCPLGVDVSNPALGWSYAPSVTRRQTQSAYRILVSDREELIRRGIGNQWDTDKTESRKQAHILYDGAPLQSRTRYYWRVQLWASDGSMTESPVSWWEMGLLHDSDWSARWIGEAVDEGSDNIKALPLFRNEFELYKPVASARAYICGLGHYELRLNGSKVSDHVLEPGWTHYDKTCLYCSYDITDQVQEGMNAVGVMLGNGFYHVPGGRYSKFKGSFGTPKCLVQLEVTHTDGTVVTIASSNRWLMSDGPLTFSCIYGGEDYDAGLALEQAGWDLPDLEPAALSSWRRAIEVAAPMGKLKSQALSPLKVMRTFRPVSITQPEPDIYVADFGQNFSGWVHITVTGERGSQVRLSPAELLKDNGTVNQKWTGSPTRFSYTLSGQGEESWSPRFSYSGFRYVQIEGALPAQWTDHRADHPPAAPVLLHIEGQMIYPDSPETGSFDCSNPLLNRTHEIINWAVLSNMKSIFTDCPHREKLGWLEQIHLMGPAVAYNTHIEPLLVKSMEDIRDAQLPSGMVPTTAPEYVVFAEPWECFRDSVSWGGAYVLIGWNLYHQYGNTRILAEHFEGMKAYIDYIAANSDGLIVHTGLGDWYDATDEVPGFAKNTPVSHTETAMFYHIVDVFSQIASLLGHHSDSVGYAGLKNEIKAAFNAAFFDPEQVQYATGSQTSHAMPLVLGLVDEPYREQVLSHLIDDIKLRGYHTTAGDIGHRYVLLALAEANRSDIIYEMACRTDYPSYGYQVEHGATTLTEAWDGPTVGKSQNHFMLGHLEEWLYRYLAGIDCQYDSEQEAFQVTIRPFLPEGLSQVSAKHRHPGGCVQVRWQRDAQDQLTLEVDIPPNSQAVVYVPAPALHFITESGASLEEAPGIQQVRWEGDHAVIGITSGQYRFNRFIESK